MDEALVKNPQHDVDDKNRYDQKDCQVLEGLLELLHRSLKAYRHTRWNPQFTDRVVHRSRSPAQRETGLKIERNRCCRQLAKVVHAERAHSPRHARDLVKRHQLCL